VNVFGERGCEIMSIGSCSMFFFTEVVSRKRIPFSASLLLLFIIISS